MNNVRDAPLRPRDFSEGGGKGPHGREHSPGGRCREQHRAPSPPQNRTLPPPHTSGLPVLSPGESASSSSQHGEGGSPGTCLITQSQTTAPRERRRFCRAQGVHRSGTGSTAKGSAAKEESNTRPNPAAPLGSGEEPGAHGGTPHTMPHTLHVLAGCHTCPHAAGEGVCVCHTCPVVVLAVCLHTHVPRRRVAASNVNARAGFLQLQVHESLSSVGGNLLPYTAGPVQAGAASGQGQHPLHSLAGGICGDPWEEQQQQHPAVQQLGEPKNQQQSLDQTHWPPPEPGEPHGWHPTALSSPQPGPSCHICSGGGTSRDLKALASSLH